MMIAKFWVRKIDNSYERPDGSHKQTLTVANDRGYSVDIDCVDKEVFDFSDCPTDKPIAFNFEVIDGFRKCVSKAGTNYNFNYKTIRLVSYAEEDIEID